MCERTPPLIVGVVVFQISNGQHTESVTTAFIVENSNFASGTRLTVVVELGVLLLFGLVFTRDGFVSNGSLGMATNLCRGTGSVLLFGLGSGTNSLLIFFRCLGSLCSCAFQMMGLKFIVLFE